MIGVALYLVAGVEPAFADPLRHIDVIVAVDADLVHASGVLSRRLESCDPARSDGPVFLGACWADGGGPTGFGRFAHSWTNPLGGLAAPKGDLAVSRAGPGWPDTGAMSWDRGAVLTGRSADLHFTTTLPRRYGDTGALHGEGLWANGTWLPVLDPADDGGPIAWHVELKLPPNTVAVLNGRVAPAAPESTTFVVDTVAERLSLAVLPARRAPVTVVAMAGGSLTFVGRAANRPNVVKQVRALVEQDWPFAPPNLVIVTDHDRQRLATAGPGVVYLSDRAFRLSPGLARFHWPAVRRALYAAASPLPDWDAQFVATALAEGRPAPSVERSLGWAAWNPIIDELLTDGTLPFYGDTFSETHLDPRDPLLTLGGRRDPRAAALQAQDLLGQAALAALVRAAMVDDVRGGEPSAVIAAARATGVSATILDGWLHPEAPTQNLRVVSASGRPVAVERTGGWGEEPVVVQTDTSTSIWRAGSDTTMELPPGTRTAAVDPAAHLLDADRTDNRAPPKWSTVVTGWVDDISPSQGSFAAWADVALRKQGDTHNLYLLGATHDAQDLLSLNLGYVRYLGPLVNRRSRTHRLYFTLGPSLLDPNFRGTEDGQFLLGSNVSYAWDTRTNDTYAFSGHRFSVGLGGGAVPGTDHTWTSAGTTYIQLIALHPRHVLATRLRAGWASGDVEHRLLPLGGADAVRAASEAEVVGNERIVGNLEYRWAVVHDASLPLPLGWLADLQLVPGIEAGAVLRDGDTKPTTAYGVDLGLYAILDVFGARPTLFGVVAALPIGAPLIGTGNPPVPQIYFSFDHAF